MIEKIKFIYCPEITFLAIKLMYFFIENSFEQNKEESQKQYQEESGLQKDKNMLLEVRSKLNDAKVYTTNIGHEMERNKETLLKSLNTVIFFIKIFIDKSDQWRFGPFHVFGWFFEGIEAEKCLGLLWDHCCMYYVFFIVYLFKIGWVSFLLQNFVIENNISSKHCVYTENY